MTRQLPADWQTAITRPRTLGDHDEIQVFQQQYPITLPSDWNRAEWSHLVRYNLHYFDDLLAHDAPSRRAAQQRMLERWVRENPPDQGTGWEPYPLSLRIVHWIEWSWQGGLLTEELLRSLALQAESLSHQLEYHLLGNHLLANAKALLFAGCFFDGPAADRWRRLGNDIVRRQLDEQILADGGHFELSPMYHSVILEDVLDLWNLRRSWPHLPDLQWIDAQLVRLQSMRKWLACLTHPDGDISFFNDAAIGIAPSPRQLEDYAHRLGLPPWGELHDGVEHLAASGYIRVQWGDVVVFIDAARLGPDYQPGHAHADTLSFEWSLRGQRIGVNSGTSLYGASAERQRQRSTAAHATVVIDEQNSSDVWGGFRVGQRAIPEQIAVRQTSSEIVVQAAHRGYCRLPGRAIHHRTWRITPQCLEITDRLTGAWRSATAIFHFHPDIRVSQSAASQHSGELRWANGTIRFTVEPAPANIAESTYHPGFDRSIPSTRLNIDLTDPVQRMRFSW